MWISVEFKSAKRLCQAKLKSRFTTIFYLEQQIYHILTIVTITINIILKIVN